jgi:hypothetical protein
MVQKTIEQRVLAVVGEQVLQTSFTFASDLKADEETMLSLEESLDAEFRIDISDPEILACRTISDVVKLVTEKLA